MNLSNRRKFLKTASLLTAGSYLLSPFELFAQATGESSLPAIAVAKNGTAAQVTRKAIELLGGMGAFVKKGYTVVVKPNIGWNRSPAHAANTNPDVVTEVIKMCFEAGAEKVLVFDRTCNDPKRCYENSGIQDAAEKAGASVYHMVDAGFKDYEMPGNKYLKSWPLYEMAMDADCFINVPIAKHHGIAELTLGMKNLMGIQGGNRGHIHWKIHQYLPELAAFVKPDLNIIDATRILLRHGPQGGDLNDVEKRDTVIASSFIGTADAYAATLFGKDPKEIGYIANSVEYGLGEIEVDKMDLKEVSI
ncbi:MAG: DUF362 domain-containing protein [candidate division Zixibacteria bacterium]|nr:DUF362 domain-containing protein [candidate division Zixibacteria bacterium]